MTPNLTEKDFVTENDFREFTNAAMLHGRNNPGFCGADELGLQSASPAATA